MAVSFTVAALSAMTVSAHPAEELQAGHWMELSTNTIQSVDPCPERDCSYSAVEGVYGTIDDWSGGAFASNVGTFGGLVVWGGGHNGYFGSEIYVFDIGTQEWVRWTEPYDSGSGSAADACAADGTYPDGSACPTHTYDRVEYHAGTNRFVIMFATPDPVCGGCDDPYIHTFDFDDNSWRLGAEHPSFSPATGASSAYDPKRDSFWLLLAFNGHFSQYDPNTDEWTVYGQYDVAIDTASAIDPTRDLFVTVDGRGSHTVIVHDLSAPSDPPITVAVEGSSPLMESGAGGFEWDPVSEQFVGWDGGAEVWTLVPPAGDWKTENWTWLRLDPAADNAVVPSEPNSQGTYSRFRYVPSLNIFVLVNHVDEPVYAYKLSEGPGVGPNEPGGETEGGGGTGGDGSKPALPVSSGSRASDTDAGASTDSGCSCRSNPRQGTVVPWLVVLLGATSRFGRRRAR